MIKNFLNWKKSKVTESKAKQYDFGCAMLYYEFPKMKELHNLIKEEDLYLEENNSMYGLENEPHTTLLYGFHPEVNPKSILDTCLKHKYSKLVLWNPSCFNNENYDVLKFDIRYPTKDESFLHKCNSDLSKYPHTTSFPKYHPHCTIAYIKKGKGQYYSDLLKDRSYEVTPNKLVYSDPFGEKFIKSIN